MRPAAGHPLRYFEIVEIAQAAFEQNFDGKRQPIDVPQLQFIQPVSRKIETSPARDFNFDSAPNGFNFAFAGIAQPLGK